MKSAIKYLLFGILTLAGCTFKIIVPNNFKTEHTFRVKLEYANPFQIDTTGHQLNTLDSGAVYYGVIDTAAIRKDLEKIRGFLERQ